VIRTHDPLVPNQMR